MGSLAAAPLAQAALEAGPIVQGLQKTYAQLQSFRVDFQQRLIHLESGNEDVRKGSLLYSKPLLVRWETLAPQAELLLVGAEDIWNYLPDEELAYRYALSLAQDSRSVIMVITGQSPLDKDFEVERLEDENGLAHLLLYPKEPVTQLTEAQLWVDPQSYHIRKVSIIDFYGNTNEITFEVLTPNVSAPASGFTFTPPPGTEVEDHRQDEGGQMPGQAF